MKAVHEKTQVINSNISITPDLTPISSLNHSMKHLKRVKKAIKTVDRDHSPYYSTKNITLSRTKDPHRHIKNAVQALGKKDQPKNQEIFTIASTKSYEKNLKLQKTLPKLADKSSLKMQNVNSIINTPSKILKNLDLNEDLDFNTQVLSDNSQYNSKAWLENVISLKDRKKENSSLIENLKFYNGIIRDIIHRLKGVGKDSEGILLERVWRLSLEVIDDHIAIVEEGIVKVNEVTQSTLKVQNEMEKIKQECENKVVKLEREIQRVKLDYILAKDPRVSNENKRVLKLKPFIESVQGCINTLVNLHFASSPKTPGKNKRSTSNRVEGQRKIRRKKSMECLKIEYSVEPEA